MCLFLFTIILSSCGADKLKPLVVSSQSNLNSNGASCSCTSVHSPVCGADNKNYNNSCIAQCFGTTVKKAGMCDCNANGISVCGSDGLDHTQCEAEAQGISIVKFIPCAATEI